MRIKLLHTLIVAFFVCSCIPSTQKEQGESNDDTIFEIQQTFLKNLASLCGKSFGGKETYMKEGRESWADKKFVLHVAACEDDRVYIPFHLDDDHSRTWMFIMEEDGLRFRHDHKHPDGTPEELNLYGGYADDKGTAFEQHFPSDDYTNQLLGDTLQRQWNVIIAEDLNLLTYQLLYLGELIFQADFDLTNPL